MSVMIDAAIAPALEPLACEFPLILHKISAGFPSPAADYVEKSLDLNTFMVQHKEASFFFRVSGESMSGAGILDDDIVLVDRSLNAGHGDIVLAVIDGEYTLKKLFKKWGRVELHPENPAYSPIILNDGNELQIWGVVVGVVRKYRG